MAHTRVNDNSLSLALKDFWWDSSAIVGFDQLCLLKTRALKLERSTQRCHSDKAVSVMPLSND
jgi:hypothetical protein